MSINWQSILVWGFGATLSLTTIIVVAQSIGLTRIDIPFIIGTMVTPQRDRAKVIGVLMHIFNGWWFAIAYAVFFETLGRATWPLGMLFGAIQGLVVIALVFPLLPGIHPRMVSDSRGPEPTRLLEPPGFLTTNYGRMTPAVVLIAHAIYGTILGGLYKV
jgi:hypothetical protein